MEALPFVSAYPVIVGVTVKMQIRNASKTASLLFEIFFLNVILPFLLLQYLRQSQNITLNLNNI